MSVIYFAYGSNLLFARLQARCPSIEHMGIARLEGHRLHFDKPGDDGSGKCGIEATTDDEHVLGVLYRMSPEDKAVLDHIEEVGHGYEDRDVVVQVDNESVACFTYFPIRHGAKSLPWDWYRAFVLEGAKENNFPDAYVARLEAVAHEIDPDTQRRAENLSILSHDTSASVGA